MASRGPGAALAALLCASYAHAQTSRPDVIYGEDDRVDYHQVQDPKLRQMMDSTAALFRAGSVTADPDTGRSKLSTSHFGRSRNLCADEPFYDQQSGAFCSGSLVGPDLLMTAGHCVTSAKDCEQTKFVFGFNMPKKDADPSSVATADVYGCAELLGSQAKEADWALIRLDRTVSGRRPLPINRSGEAPKGTPLMVVGHPSGLPAKLAGGASVRDDSKEGFLVANLDTYGGNSGSPVFNAKTGMIEGILVRGETDYVMRDGCRASNRCADDACRGEDVTRISSLSAMIPPLKERDAAEALAQAEKALAAGPAMGDLKGIAERTN